MRVVTDSVFLILTLEIFVLFLFFAFLRLITLVLICSIAIYQYHRQNFNIRLSAYICMLASLMFNLTNGNQLATGHCTAQALNKASGLCATMLLSVIITGLYTVLFEATDTR